MIKELYDACDEKELKILKDQTVIDSSVYRFKIDMFYGFDGNIQCYTYQDFSENYGKFSKIEFNASAESIPILKSILKINKPIYLKFKNWLTTNNKTKLEITDFLVEYNYFFEELEDDLFCVMHYHQTQIDNKNNIERRCRYKISCESDFFEKQESLVKVLSESGFSNITLEEIIEPIQIKFNENGECQTPECNIRIQDDGSVRISFIGETVEPIKSKHSIKTVLEKLDSKDIIELFSRGFSCK